MQIFNIDFLNRNHPETKTLIEFIRLQCLVQTIKTPTRISRFGKKCFDLVLTNSDFLIQSGTISDQLSDHLGIYAVRKKKREVHKFTKVKGRTYKNYDCKTLQNLLVNEDWEEYYEMADPNEKWDFMKNSILKHLEIMCPIKYLRVRIDNPRWFTREILEKIHDRNTAVKELNRVYTPEKHQQLKQLKTEVNTLINTAKSNYVRNTLNETKEDPKKFWRILNDMLGNNDVNHNMVSLTDGTNEIPKEHCAEFINEHFVNIGKTDLIGTNLYNHSLKYNIDQLEEVINQDIADLDITEIRKMIRNIDISKGSGIDDLPSFILKDCLSVLSYQLMDLYNCSLRTGIFVTEWAGGTITPIPKSGDLTKCTNWRPICIQPLPGKLLEKYINTLLQLHMDDHEIIHDNQYGFRRQ